MLNNLKSRADGVLKSVYEKVYIINFKKCSYIPHIDDKVLKELGKWYISTGGEWICHSDLELGEFQILFKNLLDESLKESVRFDMDYMPFQQS